MQIVRAVKAEVKHMRLDKLFDPANLPEQKARHEIIRERRGCFKSLPALCSNDLVHGSWWFVWGSVGGVIFAIIPIIVQENQSAAKAVQDDQLPKVDYDMTWAILTFSGVLFTVGSLLFVRAFEEPAIRPLLYNYKHFQTDELLAAWFFLAGTVPSIPYFLVYFIVNPSASVLGAMGCCGIMIFGCLLFVLACYPNEKKHKNYVLPFMTRWFGDRQWIQKHLATDWLAGTWFFFWANVLLTVGSFLLLVAAMMAQDSKQIFLGSSTFFNSLLFMVGSAYYVCGSYPYEGHFFYAKNQTVNVATARKRRATFSEIVDEEAGSVVVNPMAPTTIETIAEGHATTGTLTKASSLPVLSPIIEGDNESASPMQSPMQTPIASSENLQELGVRSPSSSKKLAQSQQQKTAWNPIHKTAVATPQKSNLPMSPVGSTGSTGKFARKKISDEIDYDINF